MHHGGLERRTAGTPPAHEPSPRTSRRYRCWCEEGDEGTDAFGHQEAEFCAFGEVSSPVSQETSGYPHAAPSKERDRLAPTGSNDLVAPGIDVEADGVER